MLVLNHTLFFMQLGGLQEEAGGGLLFKNDFVIFDEAHTVERVASRHIGAERFQRPIALQPAAPLESRDQQGPSGPLAQRPGRRPGRGQRCAKAEKFFAAVEQACDRIVGRAQPGRRDAARSWSELRIRQPDLVPDNLTLPMQHLREEVSAMIKLVSDKDTAQELTECNRRLGELRDGVAQFF